MDARRERLHAAALAEAAVALPGAVRRFHIDAGSGRVGGRMEVERGAGWFAALVCGITGLPASGSDVPVDLEVVVEPNRERWIRSFDGQALVSVQTVRGGLLLERFGGYTMGFRMSAPEGVLTYTFERAWFLGLPVPRILALRSHATARGDEAGWEVDSHVTTPGGATILRYRGRVEPR